MSSIYFKIRWEGKTEQCLGGQDEVWGWMREDPQFMGIDLARIVTTLTPHYTKYMNESYLK